MSVVGSKVAVIGSRLGVVVGRGLDVGLMTSVPTTSAECPGVSEALGTSFSPPLQLILKTAKVSTEVISQLRYLTFATWHRLVIPSSAERMITGAPSVEGHSPAFSDVLSGWTRYLAIRALCEG